MTTLAQMRSTVRDELGDTAAGNYVWTDVALNGWTGKGLGALSSTVPPERSYSQATTPGVKDYALSYPAQAVREVWQGGVRLEPEVWRVAWNGNSQTLKLDGDPGNAGLKVVYLGLYAIPAADAEVLEIEARLETALLYFVCWKALGWLEAQRQKRGQTGIAVAPSSLYAALYRDELKSHATRGFTSRLVGF